MFAPPFGPPDFMGSASGLHDDPLIGGTEGLGKTGQRGLDEPRFEGHPCSLAVVIEFPGHPQRFKRRCDAPGRHKCADADAGKALVRAGAVLGLLDHGDGRAGCGAMAFKAEFGELQQERLAPRDKAFDAAFADGHHLPEDGLIRRLAPSPTRATGSVAALTLLIAWRPWRQAIRSIRSFPILWTHVFFL
jgi:hypothetical protein